VFPDAITLRELIPFTLALSAVVNMEIGMITPLLWFQPVLLASRNMSMMCRAAPPFLAVLFVFLILITYIPWLSTVPTLTGRRL
jgi:C4-dicarboxylate transporter DctM subunit